MSEETLSAVLDQLDGLDPSELITVREKISRRLADERFISLSDQQIVEAAAAVERQARRDEAITVALTVAIRQRSLPAALGLKTEAYLRNILGITGRVASARVKLAERLGIGTTMTGEPAEPMMPTVAAALREGAITTRHAQIIVAALAKLPMSVRSDERLPAAEKTLGEIAATLTTDELTAAAQRLVAHLNPDGEYTDDADRRRRRKLVVGKQDVDQLADITGTLDPTTKALWDVVAEKWARPGMNNPSDPESPTGNAEDADPAALEAAVTRDDRTAAQRNHDAFQMLLRTVVSTKALGSHRGLPAQVIVTMTLDELETGIATTASGGTLPIRDALALGGASRPFLALLDNADRPLFLGRQQRLASPDQRYALIAAEKGCSRPGCDRPATRCAVHHITEWRDGGPTDINVLTLVCDADHAQINDGDHGWITEIISDREQSAIEGRVGWRQRGTDAPPRVNWVHHVPRRFQQVLAEQHKATLAAAHLFRQRHTRNISARTRPELHRLEQGRRIQHLDPLAVDDWDPWDDELSA